MSEWLDEFKKNRKIVLRIYSMIVAFVIAFVIAFLIGVIVWAVASAIRETKAIKNGDKMIAELERTANHRIFYDTETKVMYVEYTGNGGISPMYNPDGSLRVYKE